MIEPTKREMDVLQALSGGAVEGRGGLPFIGEKTIGDMLAKGWIEEVPRGGVGRTMGYRSTAAGDAVRAAGRKPKQRKPSRLKTLAPRLRTIPPRLHTLD
ncbi:MAG: hypothetical protein PGN23_15455 [Sphingomonas adhaesiva]|uniref:hypothetical protein n=1 Tax=Sphingomonas adhaesiva TaxID=28212 RepID=UPI002FF4A3AE